MPGDIRHFLCGQWEKAKNFRENFPAILPYVNVVPYPLLCAMHMIFSEMESIAFHLDHSKTSDYIHQGLPSDFQSGQAPKKGTSWKKGTYKGKSQIDNIQFC